MQHVFLFVELERISSRSTLPCTDVCSLRRGPWALGVLGIGGDIRPVTELMTAQGACPHQSASPTDGGDWRPPSDGWMSWAGEGMSAPRGTGAAPPFPSSSVMTCHIFVFKRECPGAKPHF